MRYCRGRSPTCWPIATLSARAVSISIMVSPAPSAISTRVGRDRCRECGGPCHGTARVGKRHDRHLVGPDEQPCGSTRQPLRVEPHRFTLVADRAAVDDHRHRDRFADELVHEGRARVLVDVLGRAGLLDAAAIHDHDAIRHLQGLFLIMGDENRGHLDLGVQVAQPAAQLLAHLGIERAERLVEQQHARLDRQRPRERDALTLPAGQLRRIAVRKPSKLNEIEQPADTRANLRLRQAVLAWPRAQPEGDVLEHRHVAEQGVMLEHEADMALADAAGKRIHAVELHLAVVRPVEPGDNAQQRGLARSGRAEQRQELAGVDLQIDPVQRREVAEPFADIDRGDLHGDILRRGGIQESPWRPASPGPAAPAATPRQTPRPPDSRRRELRCAAASCWSGRGYGPKRPTPPRTPPLPAHCRAAPRRAAPI